MLFFYINRKIIIKNQIKSRKFLIGQIDLKKKIYKDSIIAINKEYHNSEYDELDKILNKLKNSFQTCGLFFSGYAEGTSNNKFLEIYYPTDADISIDGYAYPNVNRVPDVPGVQDYWNAFDVNYNFSLLHLGMFYNKFEYKLLIDNYV